VPVFYRGPRAVITHQVVEVARDCRHRYVVAEMQDLHIIRHEPAAGDVSRRAFGASALVAAMIAVPVMGPGLILPAVLASVALALGAGYCLWPRGGHWWQLRADYRGEVVEVFASRDEREFTGFCRGLVRSLEAQGR
jgi:hypothetical protein